MYNRLSDMRIDADSCAARKPFGHADLRDVPRVYGPPSSTLIIVLADNHRRKRDLMAVAAGKHKNILRTAPILCEASPCPPCSTGRGSHLGTLKLPRAAGCRV